MVFSTDLLRFARRYVAAPDSARTPARRGRVVVYASVGPQLYRYDVDVEEAALAQREAVTLPANVQYAWPHLSRQYLYVASSDRASGSGGFVGTKHHVTALRIDPASGVLTPHGAPIALRARPIHISTDIPAEHVLVTYNNPSGVSVHRINADATLGAEVIQAAGLDAGIFAHQALVTPSNRLALLVTRGNDAARGKPEDPGALKVFNYKAGLLTNVDSITPNGGYGFGPRHLDFHPSKPWVYVSLERENKLALFTLEGDRLSPAPSFRKDTLADPANVRPGQAAGAVHVHPSGRFAYVTNRGNPTAEHEGRPIFVSGENSIAVYAIDPATGEPLPIQHAATRGLHPRTFHIDPSGRLLVVAHTMPMSIRAGSTVQTTPASFAVFRIGIDGRLDYVRKYDVDVGGGQMLWMGMVELRRVH